MNTRQEIDIEALAEVLHVENVAALRIGYEDGKEPGFELSLGMSYEDECDQWAYDIGTWVGASIAAHPDTEAV